MTLRVLKESVVFPTILGQLRDFTVLLDLNCPSTRVEILTALLNIGSICDVIVRNFYVAAPVDVLRVL